MFLNVFKNEWSFYVFKAIRLSFKMFIFLAQITPNKDQAISVGGCNYYKLIIIDIIIIIIIIDIIIIIIIIINYGIIICTSDQCSVGCGLKIINEFLIPQINIKYV